MKKTNIIITILSLGLVVFGGGFAYTSLQVVNEMNEVASQRTQISELSTQAKEAKTAIEEQTSKNKEFAKQVKELQAEIEKSKEQTTTHTAGNAVAYTETAETSEPVQQVETVQSVTQQNNQTTDTSNSTTPQPTQEEYTTLQEGEHLSDVAARSGVSLDELYSLNDIDPSGYVFMPGAQLRIK